MKITKELLESLGFKTNKLIDEYGESCTLFSKNATISLIKFKNEEYWDFEDNNVTELEELIPLLFKVGFRNGRESAGLYENNEEFELKYSGPVLESSEQSS